MEQEQGQALLDLDQRVQALVDQSDALRVADPSLVLSSQEERIDRLRAKLGLPPTASDSVGGAPRVSSAEPGSAGGVSGSEGLGRSLDRRSVLPNELPPEVMHALLLDTYQLPPLTDPLDACDLAVAVCAGLAGAMLDILAVRIPREMTYLSELQPGSPITAILQNALSVPTENWLSRWAKVPFDRVSGINGPKIAGMCGKQHRLLTLGHDPLLGLIFGIFDIHRGTMTGIDTSGHPFIRPVVEAGFSPERWVLAPLLWLAHLLSDVMTKAGLPIPGFSLALLLQFGEFGPNGRTASDIARFMYLKGYDLRHYFTMGLSVGAVEALVRGYSWLRYGWDDKPPNGWESTPGEAGRQRAAEALEAGFSRQRVEVKQGRLLALAHSLAAGANALKVHLYGGNPLAINLAQWQRWLWSLASMAGAWTARQETRELERLVRNRRTIDAGWEELLRSERTSLYPGRHGPHMLALAPPSAFEPLG